MAEEMDNMEKSAAERAVIVLKGAEAEALDDPVGKTYGLKAVFQHKGRENRLYFELVELKNPELLK